MKKSFLVGAVLAGAYVGVGVLLILSLGEAVPGAWAKFIMSASFAVALTLVVFTGSELFTGHTMFQTFGLLKKKTSFGQAAYKLIYSWLGNLVGAFFLAWVFLQTDLMESWSQSSHLYQLSELKVSLSGKSLFFRGILCNWLVCLALWTSSRTTSDTTKCILIFWCLYAFVACGFEHSIANMTLLALAQLKGFISYPELFYNLLWVTLGNMIGGALFVALPYSYTNYVK